MESNAEVALAAKLLRLFPATEDTFLSFPLSGAAFSADDLDIFEDGQESAEELRSRGHHRSQFARMLNQIPADSMRYEPHGRLLWDEYQHVLQQAEMATSVLTNGERRRLTKAKAFLSDQVKADGFRISVYSAALKAYYQHKEAYEQIERTLLDEQISAQATDDPVSQRAWDRRRRKLTSLRNKAMDDWLTLGNKNRVEAAQAVVHSLGGKNPEVQRQDLRNELQACWQTDVSTGELGTFSTFYSPSDSFDPKVAWQELHLTKQEVAALLQEAPAELQNWKTETADEIDSVAVEYASVVVMRPWFDPSFFASRSWRLTADGSQPVSDGQSPRTGRIPAFITNMIVARKVTITRRRPARRNENQPQLTDLQFMKRYVHTLDVDVRITAKPSGIQRIALATTAAKPLAIQPLAGRPAALGDHRLLNARMRGITIERPDIEIPPPTPRPWPRPTLPTPTLPTPATPAPAPTPAPGEPDLIEEEVVLDGVVVLAYRCRRIPPAPNPDPTLRWGAAVDDKRHRRHRRTAPDFPLPRGHWFGSAAANARSHSGRTDASDRTHISALQQRLAELGWAIDVDGYVGAETTAAVRAFQRRERLNADGRVNARTWKALWAAERAGIR